MTTIALLDDLLLDQQKLTAVERFSQRHEAEIEPLQARYYRDLIPPSKPGAGEQYAFEVDLDACSGCKACVVACHTLNGLDDGESWRDVGELHGGAKRNSVHQTVTTACHHCADPACANGCPTLAYEKDPDTGIVRHLDDQCIGCRYCELKCPYEVPKFNDRLGIVRKCDMCHGRLAEGEAPACVQACPNEAIRIRIVPLEEILGRSTGSDRLLPGTVTSDYTQPSTVFKNLREDAQPRAADAETVEPAHGHFPLVWMLVMTQAGAGLLLFDFLERASVGSIAGWHAILGAALAYVGLAGSVLHLGRPAQAWRAFLGWRKSWLSREIIVFGAWGGAIATVIAGFWLWPGNRLLQLGAGGMAALLGLAGVACSIMVYADTRRAFWRLDWTTARFALTTVALGAVWLVPPLAALALLIKMALESRIASGLIAEFAWQNRVQSGPLFRVLFCRFALGLTGLVLLMVGVEFRPMAFAAMLIGELLARSVFFRSVDVARLPGGKPS